MVKKIIDIFNKKNMKVKRCYNDESNMINQGSDLVQFNYHKTYEKYLSKYINKNIELCEVGIFLGDKIVLLNEYLVNAKIFGVDINIDLIKKNYPEEYSKFNLYKMDSTKEDKLPKLQNFDVIIDDGCHKPNSIISTFNIFYDKLKTGGIYFIEDITVEREEPVFSFLNNNNIKFDFIKNHETHGLIVIRK